MLDTCAARVDGEQVCTRPVADGAPIDLCEQHMLFVYDVVARDVGTTDLMPGPCLVCGSRVGARYPSGWVCAVCEWRFGDVPDAELDPPRIDVVYYLRFGDRIKIGTTVNPRARFAALPHDEVLAFERGGRTLERRRHEQFAASRGGGSEWFEADAALLDHIAALRAGVEDPWDRYAAWMSRELALRR